MRNFLDEIKESVKKKPPREKNWFYVSERLPDGSFAGAVIIEAQNCTQAAIRGLELLEMDDAELGTYLEIPADKVPAQQYRDRILTKEEVEELWK